MKIKMKKNYLRLVFRGLWQARSRILAIFAITALGVGFLAGLLSTTPDMYASTDAYYDRTKMMDLRLVSTLGLSETDAEAVRAVDRCADRAAGLLRRYAVGRERRRHHCLQAAQHPRRRRVGSTGRTWLREGCPKIRASV